MARVLFIEDDPVAIKAMEGIFRRSPHQLIQVDSAERAEEILAVDVDYDLLVMEVKLKESVATHFLKDLRNNPYLKVMPVVVYSKVKDKQVIRNVMKVGVQNFLIKPYKEKSLFDEIVKDTRFDWRVDASGAKKKFYKQVDTVGKSFLKINKDFYEGMKALYFDFEKHRSISQNHIFLVREKLTSLISKCDEAAFPSLKVELEAILEYARDERYTKLRKGINDFQNALAIQRYRMNLIEKEIGVGDLGVTSNEEEAHLNITIPSELKSYSIEEVEERISMIKDYPVIESAAASFQMCLDDYDMNLDDVIDMIERDAGLATAVLRCSNLSNISPGVLIGDVHQAVTVLGLRKVKLLSATLKTLPDVCSMFKEIKWEDLWMHQVGCAMLCEEMAKKLKIQMSLEELYIAGLMHDMGKILLNEVDSKAYRKILQISREEKRPLQLLEQEIFGCNHAYAGLLFAKQSKFPDSIQRSIEHQYDPQNATSHYGMVGILSVANYLCMKNEIGDNGDRPIARIRTVISHPGWNVLRPLLSPEFRITSFMRELDVSIKNLKVDLAGLVQDEINLRKRAGYNL